MSNVTEAVEKIRKAVVEKKLDPNRRYQVILGGLDEDGQPCALIVWNVDAEGKKTTVFFKSGSLAWPTADYGVVVEIQHAMAELLNDLSALGILRVANNLDKE